jgi:hypothetical protein
MQLLWDDFLFLSKNSFGEVQASDNHQCDQGDK